MKKLTEKDRNLQQIPFRLHVNDHKALKAKLSVDGLKIQTLVESLCMAYIEGDQHVKTIALEYKNLNTVDKKTASWSRREQDKLLDEIENITEGGSDE